jgi:hypothetical protein
MSVALPYERAAGRRIPRVSRRDPPQRAAQGREPVKALRKFSFEAQVLVRFNTDPGC